MRDRGPFLFTTSLLSGLFTLLLVLPILGLLAFGWREGSLGLGEEAQSAISISLRTTGASTVIIALLGVPMALRIVRMKKALRVVFETLTALPLILPPAAAGLALLLAYGRRGLVGPSLEAAGVRLAFTPAAVVLAQVFVASPFFIRSAIEAFDGIDSDLLSHAAIDGASPAKAFQRVMLPLATPGLVSGLLTAWARALGEFGATILFAGNLMGVTQTMPLAIYLGFESDLGQAAGLSILLLVVAAAVLIASRGLLLFVRRT